MNPWPCYLFYFSFSLYLLLNGLDSVILSLACDKFLGILLNCLKQH